MKKFITKCFDPSRHHIDALAEKLHCDWWFTKSNYGGEMDLWAGLGRMYVAKYFRRCDTVRLCDFQRKSTKSFRVGFLKIR